jgi:hypothetical protein
MANQKTSRKNGHHGCRTRPLGAERLETRAMLSGDGFATSVTADDVAVDALGNAYLVGSFRGTVDFDPGAATLALTSVGVRDGYLVKFNPSGTPEWVRSISSSGSTVALAVAVDASGVVVVGGKFSGIATFDIDTAATLGSAGGSDGFLAAYSETGIFQWSEAFGGQWDDAVLDVAVDATVGAVAAGETTVAAGLSSESQAFVAARSAAGMPLWDAAFPATWESSADAVAISPTGAVVVGGEFEGVLSLAPDGSRDLVAVGREDGFLVTLDGVTGATLWGQAIGGLGDDAVRAVAVDSSGQIAFGGYQEFPEAGFSTSFSSLDHHDDDHDGHDDDRDDHDEWDDADEQGFVGIVTADGLTQWIRTLVGESEVGTVAIDSLGNVTLGGSFEGRLSLDPTSAGPSLVARGREQGFVMRLDAAGVAQWAVPFDGGRASVNGVAVDAAGNTFVASTGGIFRGGYLTEIDPTGVVIRSDAFVAAGGSPWHRHDGDGGEHDGDDERGWDDDGPRVPLTTTTAPARVLPLRIVIDNQEPLFLEDDDIERDRVRRSLERRGSTPDLETYDFRDLTPSQLALLQAWSSYAATPTSSVPLGGDGDDLPGSVDSSFDDADDLFDDHGFGDDDHRDDHDRDDDHDDDRHDRNDDDRRGGTVIPVVFDASGAATLTGTVAGERVKQRFAFVAPSSGQARLTLSPDARGFYPEVEVEDASSGRELLELEPHERRGATSGAFTVLAGRTYVIEAEAPEDWVTVTFSMQLQLT